MKPLLKRLAFKSYCLRYEKSQLGSIWRNWKRIIQIRIRDNPKLILISLKFTKTFQSGLVGCTCAHSVHSAIWSVESCAPSVSLIHVVFRRIVTSWSVVPTRVPCTKTISTIMMNGEHMNKNIINFLQNCLIFTAKERILNFLSLAHTHTSTTVVPPVLSLWRSQFITHDKGVLRQSYTTRSKKSHFLLETSLWLCHSPDVEDRGWKQMPLLLLK